MGWGPCAATLLEMWQTYHIVVICSPGLQGMPKNTATKSGGTFLKQKIVVVQGERFSQHHRNQLNENEALQRRVLELESMLVREREGRANEAASLEGQLSAVWEAAEAEARVKEALKNQVQYHTAFCLCMAPFMIPHLHESYITNPIIALFFWALVHMHPAPFRVWGVLGLRKPKGVMLCKVRGI